MPGMALLRDAIDDTERAADRAERAAAADVKRHFVRIRRKFLLIPIGFVLLRLPEIALVAQERQRREAVETGSTGSHWPHGYAQISRLFGCCVRELTRALLR